VGLPPDPASSPAQDLIRTTGARARRREPCSAGMEETPPTSTFPAQPLLSALTGARVRIGDGFGCDGPDHLAAERPLPRRICCPDRPSWVRISSTISARGLLECARRRRGRPRSPAVPRTVASGSAAMTLRSGCVVHRAETLGAAPTRPPPARPGGGCAPGWSRMRAAPRRPGRERRQGWRPGTAASTLAVSCRWGCRRAYTQAERKTIAAPHRGDEAASKSLEAGRCSGRRERAAGVGCLW
jgi:hypothetical protein